MVLLGSLWFAWVHIVENPKVMQKFALTSNRSRPIIGDMKSKLNFTREEWDEAVQLYGNPNNMKKRNRALYAYGQRKGWLKTTVWPNRKSRAGLSEEQLEKKVFENSHNFHSRGEFQNKSPNDYRIALRRGWLDRMPWLEPKENPYIDKISYIYLYLFEQQKAFYVGETYHGSDRRLQHKTRSDSAVFKFAEENNIEIPEPIILEDGLERDREVRRQEHYWKLHYISLGYKTLNIGKTGEFCGSLGHRHRIWTREKCREAAMQCSHARDMIRRFPSAYDSAYRNGWLKDYTWFTIKGGVGVKRPVIQYAKDGRLVGRWDSISTAAESLGKSTSQICRCCQGKIKSALGYVWKYADKPVQMLLAI